MKLPDDEQRAFDPRVSDAIEGALEHVPPPGQHHWLPGGAGFVCSRCGAAKTGERRNRLGNMTIKFYVGGEERRREPKCR